MKTVVPQGTGGSNPPCSALTETVWSGDREAEGGSLLRSYTPKGYRGFESPLLRITGFPKTLGLRKFLDFVCDILN